MSVINPGNEHVFAFVRTAGVQSPGAGSMGGGATGAEPADTHAGGQRVLVAANFTENTQPISANELRLYGLDYRFRDLISGREILLGDEPLVLEPYQVLWLANLG
jgi:hypothetical protein